MKFTVPFFIFLIERVALHATRAGSLFIQNGKDGPPVHPCTPVH